MAKHMGILEVGQAIVSLLRENMSPEFITNPDAIGLCSPEDKGDILLGVYLYDIRECEEFRGTDMVNLAVDRQRYPSTYLTLSYMITAFSTTDVKFRAEEDQRILGKAIQVLADHSVLSAESFSSVSKAGEMDLRIRMTAIEAEEKQRIWNFPNMPYRLSLFYKVSPVELESERIKSVRRVVEMDLFTQE